MNKIDMLFVDEIYGASNRAGDVVMAVSWV
jgi:hypothetical protein